MARSENQKLKLLHIAKYLEENSNEDHIVSTKELIEYLKSVDISAERKSIYSDIDTLVDYGYDIEKSASRKDAGYYIASRDFELAELEILVDVIQASKFISEERSKGLIEKLKTLTNKYDAKSLQRQVHIKDRIKTDNKSVFISINNIYAAINNNRMVKFQYFKYINKTDIEFRRNGDFYEVSPYALIFDDEKYYLVAFDSEDNKIKHFRIDKMKNIQDTDKPREGKESFAEEEIAHYNTKIFGMYSGEVRRIQMIFDKDLADAVVDRLGSLAFIAPIKGDDDHISVSAELAISPTFFGWMCNFGAGARIVGPDDVVEQMANHVKSINSLYN